MSDHDILVLEDELLIAIDIEMTLDGAGYRDVRVFHDADSAASYLSAARPRAALLDMNLGNGQTSVGIASQLESAGVPFLFLTGYTNSTVDLPEPLAAHRKLTKPFNDDTLLRELQKLLEAGDAEP